MMDMLSQLLKKKFAKGPAKIEIHLGHNTEDQKKGTDLAPEVKDTTQAGETDNEGPGDAQEMALIQSLTHGDDPEAPTPSRKLTFEEQAKGKMKSRMAQLSKKPFLKK